MSEKPFSPKKSQIFLAFIWMSALVFGGGFMFVSMNGWSLRPINGMPTPITAQNWVEDNQKVLETVPTMQPTVTEVPLTITVNMPTAIPPLPTNTPTDRPTASAYVEPTFTPEVPVIPTSTMFFTPMAPMDGPIVLGTSVGGRPIEAFRFGTGPVKRVIVAGIHGGYEWNTVALADELIAHLQDNFGLIPKNVTLYIVRALNIDGYERNTGYAGRANDNGVDLNRNFPVHWEPEWERQGCWNYLPITSGRGPASEPETNALMEFIREIRPTALISYHSAALGIFPAATLGSVTEPDPASYRLAEKLGKVSTYPFPPIQTGCVYTGSLPDWAASLGVSAVDIELHNHEFTDFRENLFILEAFLDWRLND